MSLLSSSSSIRRSARDNSNGKKGNDNQDGRSVAVATTSSSSSSSSSRRRNSLFTAKQFARHLVQHDYHDYATTPAPLEAPVLKRKRGGVLLPFPLKLHLVLDKAESAGFDHIISWQPHGRCFVIHQPKRFVQDIMPKYFAQSKLTSFQRQLNLYGFQRLTRAGPDVNGYYHERFLRHRTFLCHAMTRTRVKGTYCKGATNPNAEPNFYDMPPVQKLDDDKKHKGASIVLSAAVQNKDGQGSSIVSLEDMEINPTIEEKEDKHNTEMPLVASTNAAKSLKEQDYAGMLSTPETFHNNQASETTLYTTCTVTTAPLAVAEETTMPPLLDCASTYTSTNSIQEEQEPKQETTPADSTDDMNQEPFWGPSSTGLMGSVPTHMASLDAEPLCLPKYDDGYLRSTGNTTTTTTTTTTTMGALYQAWQQASGMSHLLDDFVQDWIPHASVMEPSSSPHYQDENDETSWQDQSLRGMLDLILTDDDPIATSTSTTSTPMVPL